MHGLDPLLKPLKDLLCDEFLDTFEDFQDLFTLPQSMSKRHLSLPKDHY
jgi:hypothetical protein